MFLKIVLVVLYGLKNLMGQDPKVENDIYFVNYAIIRHNKEGF